MASGKLLRKLIKSGLKGDNDSFRNAADEIINEERAKKHHLLANDLQKILYGGVPDFTGDVLPTTSIKPHEIPKDKDRGLPLLEVRVPYRKLEDVILSDINASLIDEVILEQGREDLLRSYGLRPKSRLLFCGPPGCGKTLTSEVIASELDMELVLIRFDAVVSSYLGETAANLRKVFDFIERGCFVVLFDEFDAIAKERDDETEHGELKRVVNSFLQMLDSYRGRSLIIASSNHEGMLDRALWRRFDEIIYFDRPNTEQIRRLLRIKLQSIEYELPLDSTSFVQKLDGMSHAEIERIVIQAIKQVILKSRNLLTIDIFEQAIKREESRKNITLNSRKR
jgi:SpoVK/Ycf46/Vps4 family AAA+-type ATPase